MAPANIDAKQQRADLVTADEASHTRGGRRRLLPPSLEPIHIPAVGDNSKGRRHSWATVDEVHCMSERFFCDTIGCEGTTRLHSNWETIFCFGFSVL